jgi:hypothetical protein
MITFILHTHYISDFHILILNVHLVYLEYFKTYFYVILFLIVLYIARKEYPGERVRNKVIKENEKLPMNRKHRTEVLEAQEIRDSK